MEEEETLQQVIMEKAPNLKELKNQLKVEYVTAMIVSFQSRFYLLALDMIYV